MNDKREPEVLCPDCLGDERYDNGDECETCGGDGALGVEDAALWHASYGEDEEEAKRVFTDWLFWFERHYMSDARNAFAQAFLETVGRADLKLAIDEMKAHVATARAARKAS